MKKGKMQKEDIQKLLKDIVITRKEGAKGDSLSTLLEMRYGKEWKLSA